MVGHESDGGRGGGVRDELIDMPEAMRRLGRKPNFSTIRPLVATKAPAKRRPRSLYRARDVEFCRQLMTIAGYDLESAVREVARVEQR